jgi:hypothetical protein
MDLMRPELVEGRFDKRRPEPVEGLSARRWSPSRATMMQCS